MANATQTIAGDIQLAGDLSGNNNAASPALNVMLDGTTGKIPGSYVLATLTVDSKGRLTEVGASTPAQVIAQVPAATYTSKGAVQVGSGLAVDALGIVSLNAPDATYTTKGICQIDPTTMLVDNGVISIPVASTTQYGTIKVGTGLTITSGVLSADPAPTATDSTLGLVKVGTGLSISGDGTLSVSTAVASYTAKGVVSIDIDTLVVSGGELSVPTASPTQLGAVKIDSASISINGSGVISIPTATNSTLGAVTSADTNNITITGGAVDTGPNIPRLNTTNLFTKSINTALVALTYGVNIAVNASLSNVFSLTMTGNGTLTNPTNLAPGKYTFIIKQDATGSRTLSYGTAYKFVGGTPALSTAANAIDVIIGVSDGTNIYCTMYKNFA